MVYKYEIFPKAQNDLDESLTWYGEQGGQALSNRFFEAFREARKRLLITPKNYAFVYKEFRTVRLNQFPFKIIYKLEEDTVYVIAVAHDKRNPDYWLDRIKH